MGALFAPLGLMALVYGHKKKGSKWAVLLVILSFAVVTGMTLSGCDIKSLFPDAPLPTVTTPVTATAVSVGPTTIVTTTINGQPYSTAVPTPSYSCPGNVTPMPGGKTAYLTFDDGGDVGRIAMSLREQGMWSTFFVNGDVGATAAKTIQDNGHKVGLHGWTHPVGNADPTSWWTHPKFNVGNDITKLKDNLALSGDIMLRAPGGNFVARDMFKNANKWSPYRDSAYFYGWDIRPQISGTVGDEPGTLGVNLANGPDNAIILLHSKNPLTKAAVLNRTLKDILGCNGYTTFSVLPRKGDHLGYDPIGNDPAYVGGWVANEANLRPHYEDDGQTPIP